MIETIQAIITTIVAVIGVLTTIDKIGFKKNRSRTNEYYEKILKPFIVAYKKNSNINTIKFIRKIAKRDDDNIPKYIFYLIDKKKNDELKKVVIFDYFEFYDNDYNMMYKISNVVSKVGFYFMIILSFFCLLVGSLFFVQSLSILFGNLSSFTNFAMESGAADVCISFLQSLALGLLFLILYIVLIFLSKFVSKDMYTFNEKEINKLIENKVKTYDKIISKFIL